IRYLKTFDVEVVADTVKERAVVQSIAPHIPKADPMLLPIYDEPNATFNLFSVKIAMDLYDQLADVTGTKYANYLLTKDEVLAREPQLKSEGLQGGGVYLDYRNNDARLVIENIKQAVADGAHAVSRVQAVGFLYNDEGKITGIQAKDLLTDEQFEIHADVLINTTGPWSDKLRGLDKNDSFTPQMRPTKGVHLVVDKSRLNVPQPTYFDTGKQDGRMVFVVPREEKTYFGTTDTDYHGDFQHPTVEQSDVDYLLEVVNNRYPEVQLTIDDIEASWAGLRPLISANGGSDYNGGNNGKLSDKSIDEVIDVVDRYQKNQTDKREIEEVLNHLEDSLVENKVNPSAVSRGSSLERSADGLLTLAGGKLTDYRKMAEGAMKMIQTILAEEYQKEFTLIDSKNYPVSGGKLNPATVDEELEALAKHGVSKGLSEKDALYLAHLYGSNVPTVFEMIDDAKVIPGLTLTETVSLNYAMEEEMALTPVDFLLRRTNHLLFMRDRLDQVKAGVIEEMAQHYQWTAEERARHIETLEKVIEESDLKNLKVG
ncbi:type 1 glycerol-3-phosphate oxidase, partial [Enterococcus faecalis]|nr:type 1 glycerol-3-phosphate oxidase [Enterococcus faecalis]